jgi:putative membrane protein
MRTILATLTLAAAAAAACGCQSSGDSQGYSSANNSVDNQTAANDNTMRDNLRNGDQVADTSDARVRRAADSGMTPAGSESNAASVGHSNTGPIGSAATPEQDRLKKNSSTPQVDLGNLSDQQFVNIAASAGLLEVQSSQLALQKSQTPNIKTIAQRIIDDHTKANQQLTDLANKKNLTVPDRLNAADKAKYDDLSGRANADFDQQYISQQTAAHKTAIAIFKAESENGADADLKQFASQTLPTLQAHLNMIQSRDNMATER